VVLTADARLNRPQQERTRRPARTDWACSASKAAFEPAHLPPPQRDHPRSSTSVAEACRVPIPVPPASSTAAVDRQFRARPAQGTTPVDHVAAVGEKAASADLGSA
jgi:hypothetical protein